MIQDLRFAFRLMAKDRWFSAAVIVVLALGIGVNATAFTLINAALLRGLPFEDSQQLRVVTLRASTGGRLNVAYAELQDLRAKTRAFAALGAYRATTMNISDRRAFPQEARGAWVSANAFSILRQPPALGRDFVAGDEQPAADRVVIIGHSIWKNRYGSDPGALGATLRLNGQAATIVGIMPESMKFPANTDVWAPYVPSDEEMTGRSTRPLTLFGRLARDTSQRQADGDMHGIVQQLATAYPDTNKDITSARVETFTERYVGGNGRRTFIAMMGAVCFVLLIACANVANLLLSRSGARAREIAVRVALGASNLRVIRQLLLESVVLGIIGGGAGLLLAQAGARAIDAAVQDPDRPYWMVFTLDYVVVGYVAAICVTTGILFGLAPAIQIANRNLHEALKEGGRGAAGGRRASWFSSTMVVVELMLTVVLLAGAGLMIRSFINVYRLDIGISTEHLLAMSMQLPVEKYPSEVSRRAFYDRLQPRLASLPGIEAVAVTTSVPPFEGIERRVEIDGRPADQDMAAEEVTISPEFFDVLHTPLIRGRGFGAIDGAPGSEAVIVNELLASRYFHGIDPVGQRIRLLAFSRDAIAAAPPWHTIVGISRSIRHGSMRDDEISPVVYVPFRHDPPANLRLLLRSQLPPASAIDAVRREVQAIDQDQPVFTAQTLEQMLAQARWPFRVFGTLFTIFAAIALALSSVGLYSVMAYAVAQRTQEIGVRMALGANTRRIFWLVLKRGLMQVGIGLTLGIAGALVMTRVLRRTLVQITPNDPTTFAAVTLLLVMVSIVACLVPARRATRVDPMIPLRAE